MSRLIFSLFCIVCIAYSCESNLEVVERTNEDGYTERFTRRIDNGAKEGWYVRSAPNSMIVEEVQYKNDTLDGWRILYKNNGDTLLVESYKKGLREGLYREFYPEAGLALTGIYENNLKTGKWISYYKVGTVEEIITFRNGKENGSFQEFYPDGEKRAEGSYADGPFENGEMKTYDPHGHHVRTMNCTRGICRTTWELAPQDHPRQ